MERCTSWCIYSKECKKNKGVGYKNSEYCKDVKEQVKIKNIGKNY